MSCITEFHLPSAVTCKDLLQHLELTIPINKDSLSCTEYSLHSQPFKLCPSFINKLIEKKLKVTRLLYKCSSFCVKKYCSTKVLVFVGFQNIPVSIFGALGAGEGSVFISCIINNIPSFITFFFLKPHFQFLEDLLKSHCQSAQKEAFFPYPVPEF